MGFLLLAAQLLLKLLYFVGMANLSLQGFSLVNYNFLLCPELILELRNHLIKRLRVLCAR